MRLVRLGHEPAFEEIYDRHHRGILSFCRHMLGSRDEGEDAVQHTFIAAYRDLRASDKPIHLKAWLYTIARNRCLSMLRARREQVALDDVEPATEGLAAEVQRRQDLQDMLRDLHRLPHDQRAALVLSELGALSHEEIAMTLDVRKEKVKALVFQARESLSNSRQARNADCHEIQKQLAVLRGGSLRRTTLRRHVDQCPACQSYKDEVSRQRAALAVILPVAPSAGLKSAVLGGAAAAGAAGGGAIAAGGGAIGAKLLIGAVLAGAGLGGGLMAIDELRSPPSSEAEEGQPRANDEVRMAGGGNYARSDRAGRPAEGEVAGAVDRLRARAVAVAEQRSADKRSASGTPVWGSAIPGDRTGPDPAAIVVGIGGVIADLGGGSGGEDGTANAKTDDGTEPGAKKPKKPKKAKIHQGLGAQGKGHGYGRGREPAASSGNRGEGKAKAKNGNGNGNANGHSKAGGGASNSAGAGSPQRAPSTQTKPKVKSGGAKRGNGNGNGNGNQAPAASGPKPGKGPAEQAAPPPPPAQEPQGKGNGNGNGNGQDKPRAVPEQVEAKGRAAAAFVAETVADVLPPPEEPEAVTASVLGVLRGPE